MLSATLFTDGACQGNPGPGGWAALLVADGVTRELAGGAPATTNNRMELTAAIEALRALPEPSVVTLTTDSQYVRQGITSWIKGWKRNGWRTSLKQPVKNDDLWKELDRLLQPHRVEWKWVKGHAGHAENERCDLLAVAEIAKIRQAHSPADLAARLEAFRAAQTPAAAMGDLFL